MVSKIFVAGQRILETLKIHLILDKSFCTKYILHL